MNSESPKVLQKPQVLQQNRAAHTAAQKWLEWLASRTGSNPFEPGDGQESSLLNACGSILMLEALGLLAELDEEEQGDLISLLQAHQDPATGLFHLSSITFPVSASSEEAAALYPYSQLALQALDALGARARHPLQFMQAFYDPENKAAWLGVLEKAGGKLNGDELSYLLSFLVYQAEVEGESSAAPCFHQVLDWLDGSQDQRTGLWGIVSTSWPLQAIRLTSRILPFYEYVYRPVQRSKRMIDTILGLRQPDGTLVQAEDKTAQEDLAIVRLLALAGRQVSYRREELLEALISSAPKVEARMAEEVHGGRVGRPDPRRVWLYLFTLALIDSGKEHGQPWRFRRRPDPGYHPGSGLSGSRLSEHLALWQRPLPNDRRFSDPVAQKPAISVVMPCYNLGRYLYESLNSVLNQTSQDYEILIVNDGSTDEFTRWLLSGLQHPQIRVIHQENRGLAAARNQGIRNTDGRYICCLDPDDRLEQGFFERAITILDSQPEVGLVSGYFQMFDENDDLFQVEKCAFPDLLVYNQAVETAVFRRSAWQEAGGYCETFSASGIEDWDLWISILEQRYRAEVIPEVVWQYRIRPDQMSEGMYQPEIWQTLGRELVLRHLETYHQYLPDVIAGHCYRWADIRAWANERESAITWWERQANNWQELAEQREAYIQELKAQVKELEHNRQELAEQNEAYFQELKAQVQKLEAEIAVQSDQKAEQTPEPHPQKSTFWTRLRRRLGFKKPKQPSGA